MVMPTLWNIAAGRHPGPSPRPALPVPTVQPQKSAIPTLPAARYDRPSSTHAPARRRDGPQETYDRGPRLSIQRGARVPPERGGGGLLVFRDYSGYKPLRFRLQTVSTSMCPVYCKPWPPPASSSRAPVQPPPGVGEGGPLTFWPPARRGRLVCRACRQRRRCAPPRCCDGHHGSASAHCRPVPGQGASPRRCSDRPASRRFAQGCGRRAPVPPAWAV